MIEEYNDDTITEQDAEGLAHVGRAAYLLRSPKDANQASSRRASARDKKRVETLLWRAELFLDKYDPGARRGGAQGGARVAPKAPTSIVRSRA